MRSLVQYVSGNAKIDLIKGSSDPPVSILANIYSARDASGLAATGQVDSVTKEAVARHAMPNHPCYNFAGVYANCNTL